MRSHRSTNSPLPRLRQMASQSPHEPVKDLHILLKLNHAMPSQPPNWVRSVNSIPTAAAPSPPPPLRRPHLALVQPEIVCHLVPDRILHQLREVLRIARQAFVRTLENRDAGRHRVRLGTPPPGPRTPF